MTARVTDPALVEHPSDLDGPEPTTADLARALGIALNRIGVLEARVLDAPIVGWTVAAGELGVSPDTLIRRRRARGDQSRPWWSSRAALLEWYADLCAPPEVPQARARKPRTSGRVFDAAEMRRELRNR